MADACLIPSPENLQDGAAMIKMEDLKAEAQEEIKKGEGSARPAGMYI